MDSYYIYKVGNMFIVSKGRHDMSRIQYPHTGKPKMTCRSLQAPLFEKDMSVSTYNLHIAQTACSCNT